MGATMRISSEDAGDLDGLREFLGGRADVAAELVAMPLRPGTQGSVSEVLSVAVGTGGAATAAIVALKEWLTSMHTRVRIEVGDRKLTLETRDVDAAMPQVEQLLKTMLAEQSDDAES